MAQRQHVIELNGQRYDALTGQLLDSKPVTRTNQFSVKPSTPRPLNGAKAVHNKTQRSHTLMRAVVQKPLNVKKVHAVAAPIAKTSVKQQLGSLSGITKQRHKLRPNSEISVGRAIRAEHVSKSALVSKFAAPAKPALKTEVVPVVSAPSATPAPQPKQHRPSPATILFDKAIADANSHNQPAHQVQPSSSRFNLSRKALTFTGVSLLFVVVGSLAAYQSIPTISMKVASSKAGVRASVPGYQPAGFSMSGPIEYKPGEVTIDYRSNSDDRNYQVVQRTSNWNSEALLENFVAANQESYQTVQSNGRTIYVYDGGSAAWVDGGIWYQINGSRTLSSDQVLSLAKSL